jgi:uncharacterized protein
MPELTDETRTSRAGKVVVTLKAGGVFFALANVICVGLIVWGYMAVKIEPKTLQVTGSARKAIMSDLVTWSGVMTVKSPSLQEAYEQLNANAAKVRAYLVAHGVGESEMKFSAIATGRRYEQKFISPPTQPSGGDKPVQPVLVTTDHVEMYTLTQTVSVESRDVKRVPETARSITELIKDGVEIDSGLCSYLYTKLSELKIDMLAEATRDATTRAEQIVNNANGKLGKLVEARMGVMQINPRNVSATSGEGNNDTTSLEKEITAIVSARFEVK